MSQTQHDCNMDNSHTMICSSSSEFKVDSCQSNVRIDITVAEFATVRLWGQVKDSYGYPVPGILLMLVRVEHDKHGKCSYHGLAHTISDKEGFYQFDLCAKCFDTCYKILANKSAKGLERLILSQEACLYEKDDDRCRDYDSCRNCDCCRDDECSQDED